MGSWDADTNSPVLSAGGGEAANGTTTSTSANKLVDSTAFFTSTVTVGDQVVNQVDGTTALVTNIDSNTTLSLDSDIMLSGEAYTIDNSPFITQGHYYVVSVGGTTSLNGVSNWTIGDWVIAGANNEWTKLDHSQVDGTGTTGNLTKWSSTSVIADSIVSESGTAITVDGSLTTNTNLSSTGNFAVNTDKFTVGASTGNTAFTGDLAINTDKFTVNATSGNTTIAGNINLDGNIIDSGELSIYVNTSQRAQWIQSSGYSIFDANSQTMAIFKGGTDDRKLIIGSNGSNTLLKSSVNSTSANAGFEFQTGTTTALTIDSSQNATFAGMITVNGGGIDIDNDDDVRIRFDNASVFKAGLQVATTAGDMSADSAINDFTIRAQENMLFATGGNTERLRIDTSGNSTFTGIVTIENSLPKIILKSTNNTAVTGDTVSSVEFYAGDTSSAGQAVNAKILSYATDNFGRLGLKFLTGGSGTPEERLTIDSSGNVGIGIDDPAAKLEVKE